MLLYARLSLTCQPHTTVMAVATVVHCFQILYSLVIHYVLLEKNVPLHIQSVVMCVIQLLSKNLVKWSRPIITAVSVHCNFVILCVLTPGCTKATFAQEPVL